MDIIGLFMDYLPWSLAIFIVPILIIFMYTKDKNKSIKNKVEVFFKGGTKDYFECEATKEEIKFTIGKVEYKEPILYHPRVEYDKNTGELCRVFLFAEGVGLVDIPPLTNKDRDKIIKYLVDNNIIKAEDKKTDFDKYTDSDLIKYIQFYNFDVEQITDKPMMKSFTTVMNSFVSMVESLGSLTKNLDDNGPSNIMKALILLGGFAIGFCLAWALSLKGMI